MGKVSGKAIAGKLTMLVGIIFAVVLVFSTTFFVSPGHVGVQNNKMFGGVQREAVLGQGYNFVAPWVSVTEYPVSTEVAYYTQGEHEGRKSDDSITIGTKDGKTMKVDAQISYHVEQGDAPTVYDRFKGANTNDIEYGYMRQNFQRIANDLSSQYSMMDIVGEKKADYNARLQALAIDFFREHGITIEQAGLGKVEPDDATKAAIQAVANAQYQQRQAEYEKLAAVAQADKQKAVAEGNAAAKKIEADATAYYNAKMQQSLTSEIVQVKWIEKWNGALPTTSLSGQGFMVNLK